MYLQTVDTCTCTLYVITRFQGRKLLLLAMEDKDVRALAGFTGLSAKCLQ